MLVLRRRLAIAGVIIAAAITVPVAALASGPGSLSGKAGPPPAPVASVAKSAAARPEPAGSPSGKTGPPPAPAAIASKSAAASSWQSQPTALAASAGISVSRLQAGLAAAKQAGGDTPTGIAAFAASAGVSRATAQRVVDAVAGR
jgi:hypothetical protein